MSCVLTNIEIDGLAGFYLENKYLKIGVLADRGSDIFSFYYKPKETDFLLRLPQGIRNPTKSFSQMRSTKSQFEDYYYGGWQVCIPNSAPFNYRGAELGQHGEVALVPWSSEILKSDCDGICLIFKVQPLRVPLSIERRMILERDSATLKIEETVTNLGSTPIDLMWGQHIAFGLPFLKDGVKINTNAVNMESEPILNTFPKFKKNQNFKWPKALNSDGKIIDASVIEAEENAKVCSDLCYLSGYDSEAYYAIHNPQRNVGCALTWDGNLFKHLWMWQEMRATQDFPWWGQCYTVALEPWTSKWTNDPNKAILNNEWFSINAQASVTSKIQASVFEDHFLNKLKNDAY